MRQQVYLNNLDTAASYTSRLLAELLASDALPSSFFLFTELDRARTSLSLLRNSEEKFRAVLKSGLDHLFNQLVRPKLRPLLSEVYKDVSYKLDEDAYNEAEYRDDVRKRFVKAWETLLSGYRVSPNRSTRPSLHMVSLNGLCTGVAHREQLQPVLLHGGERARPALGEHDPRHEVYRGASHAAVSRTPPRSSVLTLRSAPARRPPPRPRHPHDPLVPLVASVVRVGLAARIVLAPAADRNAPHARQPRGGRGGAQREREPADDERGARRVGAQGVMMLRSGSSCALCPCCSNVDFPSPPTSERMRPRARTPGWLNALSIRLPVDAVKLQMRYTEECPANSGTKRLLRPVIPTYWPICFAFSFSRRSYSMRTAT